MNKKLKYFDNESIICSNCDKPRYMGYTSKHDSELCCCRAQGEILVYDKRKEEKELVPFENFMVYE